MKNETSFDLNLAIQHWRENLAQSPSLSRQSLDELESHLRDSSMALERAGLSAEEAYLIAAKRMGPTGKLEMEFEKVAPTQTRFVMSPGYLYGCALILLVLLLGVMTIGPLTSSGLDAAVPQQPPPWRTGTK